MIVEKPRISQVPSRTPRTASKRIEWEGYKAAANRSLKISFYIIQHKVCFSYWRFLSLNHGTRPYLISSAPTVLSCPRSQMLLQSVSSIFHRVMQIRKRLYSSERCLSSNPFAILRLVSRTLATRGCLISSYNLSRLGTSFSQHQMVEPSKE